MPARPGKWPGADRDDWTARRTGDGEVRPRWAGRMVGRGWEPIGRGEGAISPRIEQNGKMAGWTELEGGRRPEFLLPNASRILALC